MALLVLCLGCGDAAPPVASLEIEPTEITLGFPDFIKLSVSWEVMAPLGEVFASAPMQGPTWGAVRTPEWTYLRSPAVDTDQWWGRVELPPRALYRRSDDPAERTDVEADHPAVSAELERVLSARQTADRELRRRLGGPEAVERDSTEALRALGYLDREPDDGEPTE